MMKTVVLIAMIVLPLTAVENAARVLRVTGTAEVLRLKALSWELCDVNTRILEGERVRTGLRSNIDIALSDGTVIRTGEATVVDLSLVNLEKKSSIALLTGKVISKITKLTGDRSFTVSTPTALAAVRGTEFGISFEPGAKENKIVVFEGAVAVTQSNAVSNELTLKRNETVTFNKAVPVTAEIYNPVKDAEVWDLKKYTKTSIDVINIDRKKKW